MAPLYRVFRSCPRCRGRLRWQSGGSMAICLACKKELYDQPKVVVTAIIVNRHGEVLLGKRGRNPYKNKWSTLGGFVEKGETAEEALRREIYEELGLRLGQLTYIFSVPGIYPYEGIRASYLEIVLKAALPSGRMNVNKKEITQLKFFSPGRIPYKNLAFQSQCTALRRLFKKH